MPKQQSAFTLLEVLISIMLLSLVLMALYKSSEILRQSNKHLYQHLEHASDSIKGSQVLFMDILQCDSNMTISDEKEFHRLELKKTKHSLYGLPDVRVTWLVYKEKNTLLRLEGNDYTLPLQETHNVEIDPILKELKLFNVYTNKENNKFLIMLQQEGKRVQSFMVQNLRIRQINKRVKTDMVIGGSSQYEQTKETKQPSPSNPNIAAPPRF